MRAMGEFDVYHKDEIFFIEWNLDISIEENVLFLMQLFPNRSDVYK